MTSINPIATKVAAGSAPAGATPLQGSASGVLSGGNGANFFDLILSNILGKDTTQVKTGKQDQGITNAVKDPSAALIIADTEAAAPTAAAAAKKNENSLALLQIALANQGVDADGNVVLKDASLKAGTLQSSLTVTDKIINHLKTMLPENTEKEGIFSQLLSKLQAKSDNLRASLSALNDGVIAKDTPVEDIPMPLLISLGLNPAEISEVSAKIEDLEKKLGRDITVEDLIAGVGGVLPPAPEIAVVATASIQKSITTDITSGIDDAAEPTDELARQLNALDVGGSDETDDSVLNGAPKTPASQDARTAKDGLGLRADTDADADITLLGKSSKNENAVSPAKDNTAAPSPAHAAKAAASASNGFNNLSFQSTLAAATTDDGLNQAFGFATPSTPSFGSAAQAANVITTPATAGQAHPATNMVAATMVKSAKAGDDQTIRLRLDPPELGSVGIRLQFSKDKTVKAHIVAEKAETYMMLQKDSQALERVLASAGFDTAADGISFELAQDNSAFSRGDDKNAGNGNGKSSGNIAGDDADNEIIQTSIAWQVDPSTGHVRYNIFA